MKSKFDQNHDAVAAVPCDVCRGAQASDVLAVCKSCYERPKKQFRLGWWIGWGVIIGMAVGVGAAVLGLGLGVLRWATGWW